MNKKDFRIVFMGTPEFAVASLDKLVHEGYAIPAVITVPDKPAGRGKKLQASAIKQYAEANGLKILQPEKLRSETFLTELSSLKADLFVVVAFRMLPEAVWNMPPKGTINLHASLLPQYRGAAPINRAVMNGEKVTGLTTFFLTHEIDTGNIIAQTELPIGFADNAGDMHDRMMIAGADLLAETVDKIMNNSYRVISQAEAIGSGHELRQAPKIFKEDCRIDWQQPGLTIYNQIRGLSPYPAAFTEIYGNEIEPYQLKIFKSTFEPIDSDSVDALRSLSPGSIAIENRKSMRIATKDGWISVKEVQQSGRKRMPVDDYLRGLAVCSGLKAR
ncbi:MAG: methionyl-tRNA formyltransferase [Bacteroidota bacterium]|nr:methionyl-tRNA formyltransferase [Bacteroidota bacterium]